MWGDLMGEAKAQAMADAFCKMVPDCQRVVLVGADQQVKVVCADGARVARVALSMNHFFNRICCRFALIVVDPEEGEIQELFVCRVKLLQLFARGLLLSGFPAEVNGSQWFEFIIDKIAGSRPPRVIDCPVPIQREHQMDRDDPATSCCLRIYRLRLRFFHGIFRIVSSEYGFSPLKPSQARCACQANSLRSEGVSEGDTIALCAIQTHRAQSEAPWVHLPSK